MGEGGVGGKCALKGGEGAVRVGQDALLLLPVGQKEADITFTVRVSAPEQVPGPAPGVEQVGHGGLFPRREKGSVGGDAPVLAQLQLVQHPGQQDVLRPVPGAAVQQFLFGHGGPLLMVEYSISARHGIVKERVDKPLPAA